MDKDSTFREILIKLVDDIGEYSDEKVSVSSNNARKDSSEIDIDESMELAMDALGVVRGTKKTSPTHISLRENSSAARKKHRQRIFLYVKTRLRHGKNIVNPYFST